MYERLVRPFLRGGVVVVAAAIVLNEWSERDPRGRPMAFFGQPPPRLIKPLRGSSIPNLAFAGTMGLVGGSVTAAASLARVIWRRLR